MSRIILYIFFFFCSFSLRGQQCFISLGDATGIEMSSSELSQLEAAACALIDSLPAEFRDSFKVFDAGFYLHHPRYDGGIPQVFEKLKAKAALESKYYLLIGRDINDIKNILIDIKIPDAGVFLCYDAERRITLINRVKYEIVSILDRYSFGGSYRGIVKGISMVNKFIDEAKSCCVESPSRSYVDVCQISCERDIAFVRYLMEQNGFTGINIDSFTVNSRNQITDDIVEKANVIIYRDGNRDGFDVNDDIGGYLLRLNAKMGGIDGYIGYYNPLDGDECSNIYSMILGDIDDGLVYNRSSIDEFVYGSDAIVTVDETGKSMLHVRERSYGLEIAPTGKTIYLQNLDGCCVDLATVKDYLLQFYSLIGKYRESGVYIEHSLVPNIDTIGYMHPSLIRNNVLVSFGHTTAILLNEISNNYCGFEGHDKILDMEIKTSIIELGFRNFAVLAMERVDRYKHYFRIEEYDKAAAFVAFHATGHSAGIKHADEVFKKPPNNYMGSGTCVSTYYFCHQLPSDCAFCWDKKVHTVESLLLLLEKNLRVDLKRDLYIRYILEY